MLEACSGTLGAGNGVRDPHTHSERSDGLEANNLATT